MAHFDPHIAHMALWKKVVLSIFIALFVVIVGGIAAVAWLFRDLCATTVLDQIESPNRKVKAVLFQIDCGATTGFNSQVAIVPTGVNALAKDSLPESIFAVDGNAPAGKGGGPEVKLHWVTDERLAIEYHALSHRIRAEPTWQAVQIEYRTFR